PVLAHHGTPGSSLRYEPHLRDAAACGIRLLSYDRPGFGGSTRKAGRNVADCAGDVAAICDALGIDRLRAWGTSGVGPHALALAEIHAGIEPRSDGWFDDDVALTSPWGFDLASIRVPVLVWQGEQDRFVPFGHGVWLAAQIPGAEARLEPDDGHLTIGERHI